MRYEHLLDAISEDQPCGPDMEMEGDDAFIDYYYEAQARIPERFVSMATGEIFDRKSVDLKGEVAQIESLLKRTVDLRLLILEARFQALAGRITGFSECVQMTARLLKERWADVHPRVADGDPTERKNQLELLDDRSTIVMPLEHAPLFRDKRVGEVTYRGYQVASGQKEARSGEDVGDASGMQSALRSADNAEAVEKVYGDLTGALEAIQSISLDCKMSDSGSFAPMLTGVETVLTEMVAFLAEARPDLAGEEQSEGDDETEGDDSVEAGEDGAESAAPRVAAAAPGKIPHHEAAKAALLVVERYFARTEPSSPGLLLIRQARKLIGRPLTEALDTLLPSVVDQARIDFGSDTGFKMDIYKMRALAEETSDVDAVPAEPVEVPEYTAHTRADAMTLIGAVETFFRQTEPSSPVPVLLFKAKNYMNRDFSAILSELFASTG